MTRAILILTAITIPVATFLPGCLTAECVAGTTKVDDRCVPTTDAGRDAAVDGGT
jgi:hypothetical protein